LKELVDKYTADGDDDIRQLLRVRCALGHLLQKEEKHDEAIAMLGPVVEDVEIDVNSLLRATAAFEMALCHYIKEESEPAFDK